MTSLNTDEYLTIVEADEDPDPPRDGARLPTTWRDRLPEVFGLVICGLVTVVLAGTGAGVVVAHGMGHRTGHGAAAPSTSRDGTSIAAAAVPGSTTRPGPAA